MATSRCFQAEMETDVRQFCDEAMVPDFYSLLRVIRFGFPADLFSFCQIFKVAHYPFSVHLASLLPSLYASPGMRSYSSPRKLTTEQQLYTAALRALMRRAHSIHEMKKL